jgi:hypothetical protein
MSRARRMRRLGYVGLLVTAVGCGAGWHQAPTPASGVFPPRQQVQLWRDGKAVQLHAVVVTADSVTGIPYIRPLTCDSCRITLQRAAVDSIRLGNPVAGFWKTFGLVLGIPLAVLTVVCWSGCFPST